MLHYKYALVNLLVCETVWLVSELPHAADDPPLPEPLCPVLSPAL